MTEKRKSLRVFFDKHQWEYLKKYRDKQRFIRVLVDLQIERDFNSSLIVGSKCISEGQ